MNRREFSAATAAGAGLAAMPATALATGNAGALLDIQGTQVVKEAKPIRLSGN